MQEDKCTDEETRHYPETFSYFLAAPTTNTDCDIDGTTPVLGEHTFAPTRMPTPRPSMPPTLVPTASDGAGANDASETTKSKDILLAVFLPICIVVVVAVVGVVTKKVFLTPPPADGSEHSGLNLMP